MQSKFYNVHIGVSPINWNNDDMHDMGDRYSYEDILDAMSALGFEGSEVGHKYPRDTKVLKKALGSRNLVLSSGWSDLAFTSPKHAEPFYQNFEKHARFLHDMGCRYVICAEITGSTNWDPDGDRSGQPIIKLDDAGYQTLADGLKRAGEFCRSLNMELVYHVHAGTCIENLEETKKLFSLVGSETCNILADTGHLAYCGVNIPEFFSTFADRIRYIHLKDVRADVLRLVNANKLDFNTAARLGVFTVPGDGSTDFAPVMDILADAGYQGWMILEAEQHPDHADPIHYAKKARRYLNSIMGLPVLQPNECETEE